MNNEIDLHREPEITQFWSGFTRIDGVYRATIDEFGNTVVVTREIDFLNKRVVTATGIWLMYEASCRYFVPASI